MCIYCDLIKLQISKQMVIEWVIVVDEAQMYSIHFAVLHSG